MPKMNKTQASFNAGQISKSVYGRVDDPRYDKALALCFNYLPINQGPLLRRPGSKYAANAKDASNAPVVLPFQFSGSQNYILEFGDKYVRFYQNEGQTITSSTSFLVSGGYGPGQQAFTPINGYAFYGAVRFTGIRSSSIPGPGEVITASSVVASGSILEVPSPYSVADVQRIKITQKQDVLYLTHPNYPTYKMVRTGSNTWDLKQLINQDGPYLPLNSYASIADAATVFLQPTYQATNSSFISIATGPTFNCSSVVSTGANSFRVITSAPHSFAVGQRVFITGVVGTTEVNNINGQGISLNPNSVLTPTNSTVSWAIASVNTPQSFDVQGLALSNAYVGSGVVSPALFQAITGSSGLVWADVVVSSSSVSAGPASGNSFPMLRNIGFITAGTRYAGNIIAVQNAAMAYVFTYPGQTLPSAVNSCAFWQLGTYNQIAGFPAACCFHQDRLILAGPPGFPQELDGSMSGNYEVFSASGSNLQVSNNNALQFSLNSQELNAIRWLKSSTQGLLAGTQNSEWSITPSTQSPALTPTSINATETTHFGSADADSIQVGNATLYIQRAQRKVRELIYFWQVGNFRSNNMTELAEFITLPAINQLINQREVHPTVWAKTTNGQLLSMCYKRDDVTLESDIGWAEHQLGGQSDSAGSPPLVLSMATIPSSDTSFDELWMVVKRFINGTSVVTVEYLSKSYDDNTPQEMSYHFDCGQIYNSSIIVTGVSIGSSCVVTAPNHGLANSSTVRFYNTVGINIVTKDVNGNATITNQLNENTFVTQSATVNTFQIFDFLGNAINTNSSSIYVGSCVVKALVSSIGGLSWLAGETVSVLGDGSMQANTTVSQSGLLNLSPPAAVVSVGYAYNSDGQLLRTKDGSAQGTSIGSNRRVNRVAFMLHDVGDFSFGPSFTQLIPLRFEQADVQNADTMTPLFDGVVRQGIESGDDQYTDTVCFRQTGGLPGMIQAITRFVEENDV